MDFVPVLHHPAIGVRYAAGPFLVDFQIHLALLLPRVAHEDVERIEEQFPVFRRHQHEIECLEVMLRQCFHDRVAASRLVPGVIAR